MSLEFSWEDVHRWCRPSRKQHERSCIMTILSLADCCRHLAIDPKTLRRWLAQAPFTRQSHPQDARLKGLTEEQLRWLAQAHHRHLATLPQEQEGVAPTTPIASLDAAGRPARTPPGLARAPGSTGRSTGAGGRFEPGPLSSNRPSATARSRSGPTTRAAGRRRSRGRSQAESLRQQRRPSQAQVLALVEYAGEGHYVVISPRGGLLPFEPDTSSLVCLVDDLLVVSFCGQTGALDCASGTPQRLESRLACPSQHPQSHLQRPSRQD